MLNINAHSNVIITKDEILEKVGKYNRNYLRQELKRRP